MSKTLFEESYLEKAGFVCNRARTVWVHPNGATIRWKNGQWVASLAETVSGLSEWWAGFRGKFI